jgi:hypothetical protein
MNAAVRKKIAAHELNRIAHGDQNFDRLGEEGAAKDFVGL